MKVVAKLKNASVTERKARLVADMVRGTSVADARKQLRFSQKKSSDLILGLLNSAVANAEHNDGLDPESLHVQAILVDGAGMLKRYQPRAFGRAYPIRRRKCHITLTLEGTPAPKKAAKPKKKAVASGAKKDEKKAKADDAAPAKKAVAKKPSAKKAAEKKNS